MTNIAMWSWTSPVWLAVAALLIGYVAVAQACTVRQVTILLCGLLLMALVFVSPVGVLSDGYLFSAHMVQHLVLLLVVPAALLLSFPKQAAERLFRRRWCDCIGRWLAVAWLGWVCGVGAMWFWHVPALCSAATQRTGLGVIRDVSLVLSGVAFWWPIYAPLERYRLSALSGMAYLFSTCVGCTLLGIYITFAPVSVCRALANPVDRLGIIAQLYDAGLTPGVDQHLGGLLMWVPPCMLYIGAIIGLLCRWQSTLDQRPRIASHLPHQLGHRHGHS